VLVSNSLTGREDRVLYLRDGDDPYGLVMDRPLVISCLQTAEARVANGKQEIADQQDFVLTLERTGHAATSAVARLREMERVQAQHIVERDRLRAELEVLNEAAKVGAYE
jgi:cell division septum initiation protein DivIVA